MSTRESVVDRVDVSDLPQTRVFEAALEGITDLLFGAPVRSIRASDEDALSFDRRTCHEKIHTNKDGEAYLLGVSLQKALVKSAVRRGELIAGRGKSNFTSRFKQGVFIHDMVLRDGSGTPIIAADIPVKELFVPLQPQKPNGPKGYRCFPYLTRWFCSAELMIFDNLIDADRLQRHIEECGMFCGLGSMNVGNGHNNGRFRLLSLTLKESH